MWTDAFAQAQGSPPPANSAVSMLLMLLQFLPIIVIVYFLVLRPQQQKQKHLEKMVRELKKGDRVLTSGGIYGTVIGLDGPKAVLKIADETKVEFAKTAIVQVLAADAK